MKVCQLCELRASGCQDLAQLLAVRAAQLGPAGAQPRPDAAEAGASGAEEEAGRAQPTRNGACEAARHPGRDQQGACFLCLGLLECRDTWANVTPPLHVQGAEIRGLEAEVWGRVRALGYAFESYALELTLPRQVLEHQEAAWREAQQGAMDPGKGGPIPAEARGLDGNSAMIRVKDVLKALLEARERTEAGGAILASDDAAAELRIRVTAAHERSAPVGPAREPDHRSRKRHKGYSQGTRGSNPTDSASELYSDMQGVREPGVSAETPILGRNSDQSVLLECSIHVQCTRAPVYVSGRYLKLSRELSQSPWMVEEERMGKGSVQECIAHHLVPAFAGSCRPAPEAELQGIVDAPPVGFEYKFQSAGREDLDVRMLGPGRPFLLEFRGARRVPAQEEIAEIASRINAAEAGKVHVRGLRLAEASVADIMREGESEKQKCYTAVVSLSRGVTHADMQRLSNIKDLVIQQKTPIRVLHRRSPMIRPRTIFSMRCEPIQGDPHLFLLHCETQAGTYVKEFVHGDFGRTAPSIGSLLGCSADILQLDVTDIKMNFLLDESI